ncbi:MAG: hypothetical protein AAB296_07950 [Candidatus Desantisbacteria bacterium]
MAIVAFPSILNKRLTDTGAQALAGVIDKANQDNQKATLVIAEGRFEKRMTQLEAKIDGVETRLEARIDGVETRLEAKIDGVEAKIEAKTEKVRADIIMWMFIFWVGQVGTMIAIFFAFNRG